MVDNTFLSDTAKIAISGFIAFMSGRYSMRHSRKTALAHEEFQNVIFPMYRLIQPYLYKSQPNKSEIIIVSKLLREIANQHMHLVPERLFTYLEFVIAQGESDNNDYLRIFDLACFIIEKRIMRLKATLGLPYRTSIQEKIEKSSIRRMKARLHLSDTHIDEIGFIIAGAILLGLTCSFLYRLVSYLAQLFVPHH